MSSPLSIVIATYNREGPLRDTIQNVREQSITPADVQIVDHSDGHEAATEQMLADLPEHYSHSYLDNGGLCEARNYGLANATGDIIVYIDDDVRLSEGFLKAHLDAYSDPDVGAVAGQVLTPEKPDPVDEPPLGHFTWYGRPVTRLNSSQPGYIRTGRGCNMSFRRALLQQVGGFDTKLDFRDEADVFSRIHRNGHKIRFEPDASLFHRIEGSGGTHYGGQPSPEEIAAASKNKIYYQCKNHSHVTVPFALLSSVGYRLLQASDVRSALDITTAVLSGGYEGVREYLNS